MAYDNLQVTYRDFFRDIRSFPPNSPMAARLRKERRAWLDMVKVKYGEEMVTRLTGKQPVQVKQPTV